MKPEDFFVQVVLERRRLQNTFEPDETRRPDPGRWAEEELDDLQIGETVNGSKPQREGVHRRERRD